MIPFWKNIVLYATVLVAEPDQGEFNHLLKVHHRDGRDYLVSFTGPIKLGNEKQLVLLRLEDVECEEVIGCEENPYYGPKGYQAWICNANKATRLKEKS